MYDANPCRDSNRSLRGPIVRKRFDLASTVLATLLAVSSVSATPLPQGLPLAFPEEIAEQGTVRTTVKSPLFMQTYWVDAGTSSLLRVRSERVAATDRWTTRRQELSVSFAITAFAWRNGGDEIFLAGLRRDGTTTVERWRFDEREGAREVRYQSAPPPVGVPQAAYTPAVSIRGNVEFRSDQPNSVPVDPTRLVLWDSTVGPITAMAADPEGRYLVIWNYSTQTLQRALLVEDPTATPISFTAIYSAATSPLLDKVGSIEIRDFGTEGRKLLLRRHTKQTWKAATERFHVIADANNDGVMDSIQSFSVSEIESSPYGTWETWKEFWKVP